MTATSVSVVVPLHNGADIIEACVDSIPPGVEVVVVDDASTDGADALVAERYPHVRLSHNDRNLGFAGTANTGLAIATGAVRIVLNSDARLRPGALEHLVAAFDDASVGIAGPRLVFPDGSHQTSAARFPTVASFVSGAFAVNEVYRRLFPNRRFRWELGLSRSDHDHSAEVDWVHGTCIALSRECFETTGGFDTGYHMYVEECDLCWRARQEGWRVRYVAEAVVEHIGGASGGGDPTRQARYNLAGEARFMERAYGTAVLRRWRIARLASSAVKALVFAPLALFDARVRQRLRWHLTAIRELSRGVPRSADGTP